MRQPVPQTLPLQQAIPRQSGRVPVPLQRSYRWGQIHGALMIAVGLMLLRPHPAPVRVFMATLAVILGICVLRRNKLILPLMVAWPLVQLFVLLNHPVFPGERPVFPPLFPLILWCAYIVYYYRRRDEFVNWV